MNRSLHGVVHGDAIHLPSDHGLVEGQSVEVVVSPQTIKPTSNGDGLRRAAGALADDWTADDDRILEEIQSDRKRDARQEPTD